MVRYGCIYHTILISVIPVCVDLLEIGFAEACHERHFPEDSLDPWTGYVDFYSSFQVVACYGGIFHLDLLGLEAI